MLKKNHEDKSCLLVVEFAANVVAKGTIMKYCASDENIEVMMETILQGKALIPIPLEEEFIVMVKDALRHILYWPRHLVIRYSDLSENDLFGYDSYTYLTWDDFEAVLTMDEMTCDIIVSYMMVLFNKMKYGPSERDHGICFVNPTLISPIMKSDTCYYLDSLISGNFNMQLKQIVDLEMVIYDTQSGSNKRPKLNWVNVTCPIQPGSSECGYYMLRFMKEIVKEGIEVLVKENIGDGKVEYTTDDIDEIHKEWS
ncbi:unnamed protein product [Lactuca saligna]|uniref:Ubiquitin-like protease family profile domain-containing protein n=1 Tax=Lactuca saligna TaxID=75948 RepID=A0AA35ZEG9_LACSI|nr:unnamed protein product [Lactuca saligna]